MERVTVSPTVRFAEGTRNGGRSFMSMIIPSLTTHMTRFARKEQYLGDVLEEGG